MSPAQGSHLVTHDNTIVQSVLRIITVQQPWIYKIAARM